MKNLILRWSKKKYGEKKRIIALIPAGLLFLIVIPIILVKFSLFIDAYLHLPSFMPKPINFIVAVFLIISGLSFSAWSILVQFKIGKGTPIPLMPTRRLIVEGPYAYCRNPMTLGIILYYLGISVWITSSSSIVLTMLFTASILTYVKLVEEKELKARFGQEYIEYKKKTPFLIPRKKK